MWAQTRTGAWRVHSTFMTQHAVTALDFCRGAQLSTDQPSKHCPKLINPFLRKHPRTHRHDRRGWRGRLALESRRGRRVADEDQDW